MSKLITAPLLVIVLSVLLSCSNLKNEQATLYKNAYVFNGQVQFLKKALDLKVEKNNQKTKLFRLTKSLDF